MVCGRADFLGATRHGQSTERIAYDPTLFIAAQ
jgi:hypothetical protein